MNVIVVIRIENLLLMNIVSIKNLEKFESEIFYIDNNIIITQITNKN